MYLPNLFVLIFMYIIFTTFAGMTVKEFLKTNPIINISAIAKAMWPDNSDAPAYLLRKLSDKGDRQFTKKDAEAAIRLLKEFNITIEGLTVE